MSLRSVIRIKSCTDNDRMGFAFAEYWTVQDAVDAHERSRRKDHQCTVSSQRFSTSFPHLGVFRPTSKPSSDGSTEESPAFFLESKSTWYNYYDERYYATITTINENEPAAEPNPLDKIDRTASDAAPTGSKRSANALENVQSKSKKPKTLDSGVPMLAQMQKWQDAAGELRGETSSSISGPQSTDEQTFAVDTEEHKRCYLCNTMFGASEALVTHLKKSAAHLAFAKDEKRRQKGFGRLEKNGVDPASTIKLPPKETATGSTRPSFLADQASAPQARDRAAERRQQEAAAPPSFSLKKAAAVSAAQKPRPGSSGSDAARPSFGVGRKMLQQAGWSEGQGLGGESGTGMAAPLEQQMFAAGVGLGHEGSRRGDAVEEAERATKGGRGDFAEMTRENARKRFGRM